uniref:CRIB domain-containing protein RIC4-like n=1 Tax=Erigeron canadensis TaxID=72917 RepID=UPI001CB90CF4|nr:CRIB domain-containing protein RIC4-like [Erigeron canadensis]
MMMKDRMERLVAFPFATACVSASSVAVCVQHGRRSKEDIDFSHMVCRSFDTTKDPKVEEGESGENIMKSSFKFTSLSKPSVSIRLQRLTKTIKNLSQSLGVKEEMGEVEMEMEIGVPTDVKHVAHVGFDGSVTSEAANHQGTNLTASSDFLGFCPISFARLEERLALCVPLDTVPQRIMEHMLSEATNKTKASLMG